MIFQPNSRLITLLGISALIHVLVFLVIFSKATISTNKNNRALTVGFMQLPPQVEVKTLTVPRGENALQNNADEPTLVEKTAAKAGDLEPLPSKTNANDNLATLPLALPEPTYYAFNELDAIPMVLKNIEADPPEHSHAPRGGSLTEDPIAPARRVGGVVRLPGDQRPGPRDGAVAGDPTSAR